MSALPPNPDPDLFTDDEKRTRFPHVWVGAATVVLTAEDARTAVLRNAVTLNAGRKLNIIDTYCGACRLPYSTVADTWCQARIDNTHLRGGPIGERRKRAHANHNCAALGCVDPATGQSMAPNLPASGRTPRRKPATITGLIA